MVGAPSYPQLGKSRHHLLVDEMTCRSCKGEGPVYGSQHVENSSEVSISEKMLILSTLTTLTIDIHKIFQSMIDFQHHLAVTAPAIVEVYVLKIPTIRLHSPPQ